jgi:pimeloyl-ACP methyl ester carboxylesterase
VNAPIESMLDVNGHSCRVWRKGDGERLGYIPGYAGLPRWTPFLDELCADRCVIAPSLPGFPGGGTAHTTLDTQLDWVVATRDLLVAADLEGADIVATGFGAALIADVAALWPASVRRLTLIAPFGIYFDDAPIADVWAPRPGPVETILVNDPARYRDHVKLPEGADAVEWPIMLNRANEAAARYLWPLGNTGLAGRLHRIAVPTLLLWGEDDQVVPPSYAERYKERLGGRAIVRRIARAGHLAELDQPQDVAREVLEFVQQAA